MKPSEITKENLIDLLDKHYELIYVDYRDVLYDHLDRVQDAIQGNYEPLDELIDDCYWDDSDSLHYILKESLPQEIKRKYNELEDDEIEELIEEYEDDLSEAIHERDESDPLKDLIRNTGEVVFFYDIATETEWNDNIDENVKIIKKALKIKLKDETYDKVLRSLVINAYYGGRLVIYFNAKISKWMDINNENFVIEFTNPVIALIDNENGSGNHEEFDGLTVKFPFNKENLFIDKATHYSYVYDVCGLDESFCNSTKPKLYKSKNKNKIEKSSLHDHLEQEKKYDKIYNYGKCSFGDMNSKRHRNTEYINNFPCGTKCKDCGTFWID